MHTPITETGSLGIMFLKQMWSRTQALRQGSKHHDPVNRALERSILNVLRLSYEPTFRYLLTEGPTFEAFEQWILEKTGTRPDPNDVEAFNNCVLNTYKQPEYLAPAEDLLTEEEWHFWETNGYLIIRNAVSPEDCATTVAYMFEQLGIRGDDPSTWYKNHADRQGIMVQLFHNAQMEKNRRSPRIKRVFEQLWQRNDILPTADRLSFNPPETVTYPFQGPDLHWDVSLKMPIPFGTQGILYLSDTASNQGAFTLVPGFQHKIGDWLQSLPDGASPQFQDLHALGSQPIAASAGDLIIWHQALPHGSSPNTSALPRLVQYINYEPINMEIHEEWIA